MATNKKENVALKVVVHASNVGSDVDLLMVSFER
jgi:hypothetical protein